MATGFDSFYQEFVAALAEVVESGRIVGDTPEDRKASCIAEVKFVMRGVTDYGLWQIPALVDRHYKG